MNDRDIAAISDWLTAEGLKGAGESALLTGFCQLCNAHGLQLDRALVLLDTLHPVYEGRAFRWDSREAVEPVFEYGPSDEGTAAENWQKSVFFYLRDCPENEVRRRIAFGDPLDFYMLDSIKQSGQTDYIAMIHRFSEDGSIGDMDCVYSQFTTTHNDGFSEGGLAALRRLMPLLALAIKCTALGRIARTIAEVYLGEDAARRVLAGKISRGKSERISAVLWFSDLRDYTRISDTAAPGEIIPLLNDYSDAVISSIHAAGGNVLKLMGDGTLAIFKAERAEDACSAALEAEGLLRDRLAEVNAARGGDGHPVTEVYLGLHIGEVFYGNIGSQERLDFTVIGPAVNEVSRISAMCRSVDRNVLLSSDFVIAMAPTAPYEIVSVGRYALRGVKKAQELFTLA